MLLHIAVSLGALGLFLQPAVAAPPKLELRPDPEWVEPVPFPSASATQLTEASDGVHYLLTDKQTRTTKRGTERYIHLVEQVVSEAGIESVSQVRIRFDPSFERATLHRLRLHRAGTVRDLFRPADVTFLQQETALERQLLNGELTALIVLKDVRVGDVLETAYSLAGDNPVFGNKLMETVELGFAVPTGRIYHRVVFPEDRAVHHREFDAPPPREQLRGGERHWVWDLTGAAGIDVEDRIPAWFQAYPFVQLSEYSSWKEVVDWALPLYRPGPLSPEMVEQVRTWKRLGSDEARLLAALRFVQDEVRYFGIELGANSHRPHAPALVFERRFGDCKDKTLLLVSLLGALGIEAHAAVVNTNLRHAVEQRHPSPLAFDHVIARVRLAGRTYWFDATRSMERGPLADRLPPSYQRALVIAPGEQGLTVIPEPQLARPTKEVEELFTVEGETATLKVTTRQRGWAANWARQSIASSPDSERSDRFLNFYAKTFPTITVATPLAIRDDPDRNEVVTEEHYRLGPFWEEGARELFAHELRDQLDAPDVRLRKMPLALSHPVHLLHRIRVNLPPDFPVLNEQKEERLVAEGFSLEASRKREGGEAAAGNTVTLEYRYTSRARSLPPEKVAQHLKDLDRAIDLLAYRLEAPSGDPAAGTPARPAQTGSMGLAAAFAFVGLIGLLLVVPRIASSGAAPTPAPSATPSGTSPLAPGSPTVEPLGGPAAPLPLPGTAQAAEPSASGVPPVASSLPAAPSIHRRPSLLGDLREALRVSVRAPVLPLLNVLFASFAGLYRFAEGPLLLGLACLSVPLLILLVGWRGVERLYFLRRFRGQALPLAEAFHFTTAYSGRFWMLLLTTLLSGVPLFALVGFWNAFGGGTSIPMELVMVLWGTAVETLCTFAYPALAFSTSSARKALAVAWRMLRDEPRSAAPYALLAGMGHLLLSPVLTGVNTLSASAVALHALSNCLQFIFAGAAAAHYLRRFPEVGEDGAT